jgi:hypothetical protein
MQLTSDFNNKKPLHVLSLFKQPTLKHCYFAYASLIYITTMREAKHITAPTKPTTVLEELLGVSASAASSPPSGPGAKDGLDASAAGASAGESVTTSEGEGADTSSEEGV